MFAPLCFPQVSATRRVLTTGMFRLPVTGGRA